MHVLWLIPEYYTFLVDEMAAVAPRVDRLTVISQATPPAFPGVNTRTIERDRLRVGRAVRRTTELAQLVISLGTMARRASWRQIRRLARHNEVIRDFVRDENVDVIHSHFAVPEGTGGTLAGAGVPAVMSLRGVDVLTVPHIGYGFRLDPFYAANLQRSVGRAAAVTVPSESARRAALDVGTPPERLVLDRHGIDLARFSDVEPRDAQACRRRYEIGDAAMIFAAGNLVPVKAFDLLIRAVHQVHARHRFKLVIGGDGPCEMSLRGLVLQLKLEELVRFAGRIPRNEMPVHLAACDVLAHSSWSEAFGNAVIEAMAMGRPVVTTRTGAAADVIDDRLSGVLAEPGSVEQLAEGIDFVLSNAICAREMGARARERVRPGMDIEQRAARLVRIYERATGQARRG